MYSRPNAALLILLVLAPIPAMAQSGLARSGQNGDWPVYQGDHGHTH